MEAATTWVFKAGDGAMPPALTGRTAEQAVLRRCLAGVSHGEAPPHNVVLLGPCIPSLMAHVLRQAAAMRG